MPGRVDQRLREAALPVAVHLWPALAALADPVRLRIIILLREREQCICHLTTALGLTQGTVSHHMAMLKRAGLVLDRPDPDDARWVYFRLDDDGLSGFQTALAQLLDSTRTDHTPAACCGRIK
jgi:ArsR family transcriptional regulator